MNEKQTVKMDELQTVLMNKFDTITPKHVGELFNVGGDGKLIRRHLRAKFAVDASHEHNNNWIFKTTDKNGKMPKLTTSVLEYFYGKYAVNTEYVNTLKTPKTDAK
jgi:hypothetical protein